MKRLLIAVLMLSVFSACYAKELTPEIYLQKINVVKQSEAGGDEIYLVITEFHSSGENRQYTVPQYPVHWPARALNKVKDLKLWEGELMNGQSAEVIFEVVEHDAPPFNVDDLIGSAKLKIKNKRGKIEMEWEAAGNLSDHKTVSAENTNYEQFSFKNNGGEYVLDFEMRN